MEEYGKATQEDNTSTKESDGKSSKRKTRALPHMGGLAAAEGSIWQRDRETPSTEQKRPVFEATKTDKPAPAEQSLSTTPETPEQPPTQAETEADERLSNLTPEESRQIALRYAEMRAAELAEEAASEPTDPAEQAATEADMELVAALRDRLQADPTTPPSEVIAGAYNETLEHVREPDPQPLTEGNTPLPPPLPPGRFAMFPNEPPQPLPTPEAAVPAADTITLAEAAYYERQAENRGLLVGGIVGYLLGRRRGRIKTQKRLLPVQHKLEKQVAELHRSIAEKEREIRTVAAQKARRALPPPQPELMPNRFRTDRNEQPADTSPVAVPTEILPPRPTFAATETLPAKPERHHPEQLQQLSPREIQELSKKIIIDGTSVYKIYESKRITESGLNRIVHEYLRGQDVKKVLEQEMLIKELTYERDPRIRDSMSAATSSAAIAPLLPVAAAAVQLAQSLPGPLAPAESVASQSPMSVAASPRAAYSPEQTIMRAWVAIIVLLAVIAVVLILK